jgi:four helix bundle protein
MNTETSALNFERLPIRSFEDLDCWKACRLLRMFIFRSIVPKLPADEKHRLADQLIRAGRATTANIAEGYGRYNFMDNRRFCGIARGSCLEVVDHLITAGDERLIDPRMLEEGRQIAVEAVRLVSGYMAYLKRAEKTGA